MGRGRGRVPFESHNASMPKKLYCEFHGPKAGHTTKTCPVTAKAKERLAFEEKQQAMAKMVNHTAWTTQPYCPVYSGLGASSVRASSLASYPHQQWQHDQQQLALPPPPAQAKQEEKAVEPSRSTQPAPLPSYGMILPIQGGSAHGFENKRQRKDYFRQVSHISVQGPMVASKWSDIPISFTLDDLKLTSFPHKDAMIIEANVGGWMIGRVLVDNGSSADILFTDTFDKMNLRAVERANEVKVRLSLSPAVKQGSGKSKRNNLLSN